MTKKKSSYVSSLNSGCCFQVTFIGSSVGGTGSYNGNQPRPRNKKEELIYAIGAVVGDWRRKVYGKFPVPATPMQAKRQRAGSNLYLHIVATTISALILPLSTSLQKKLWVNVNKGNRQKCGFKGFFLKSQYLFIFAELARCLCRVCHYIYDWHWSVDLHRLRVIAASVLVWMTLTWMKNTGNMADETHGLKTTSLLFD